MILLFVHGAPFPAAGTRGSKAEKILSDSWKELSSALDFSIYSFDNMQITDKSDRSDFTFPKVQGQQPEKRKSQNTRIYILTECHTIFSPIIEMISVTMKNRRQKDAGS